MRCGRDAAIVALVLALATAVGPAARADEDGGSLPVKSTQADGIAALKQFLAESGLKYEWNEKDSFATITFSGIEHASTNIVYAYVPDKKGFYIKLFMTLIDKPDKHRFSPAMLREAMKYISGLWLLRVSYDENKGDIDASVGFDREGMTPKVFTDYVMHLVNTGDELAGELKPYVE